MEYRMDQYDFKNKKAIIRVDFNVPIKDGVVTDETRIKAALPTINKVIAQGGSAILMSHLGRPSGFEDKFSLKQVIPSLEELLGRSVAFASDCKGTEASQAAKALEPGQVLLLENLRYYPQETEGDKAFAAELASLADVYINDAFGTAHRAHASTAVIAEYMEDAMPGYLMQNEVSNARAVLESAEKPFAAIVGGAKVSSKISVLENLVDKVDHLIIGGGMAFTFFKANGGDVGSSLVEDDYMEAARLILKKAEDSGVSVHLPVDSVVADRFAADAEVQTCASDEIPDGWMGLDIGQSAIKSYSEVLAQCKTILWNGPMGVFEMDAFAEGTRSVAMAVADATQKNGAYSLIGGGDSVAAINAFNLADKVSYISTGGGAMLELLEGKTLPGVAAVMSPR